MLALLIFPSLALTLLGAHFLRVSAWPLVLACVALLMLMLLWRRAWVARTVQLCLLLGAFEWFLTLFWLLQMRMAMGQPWLRMALILGAVALLTAAAALVFQHPRIRARYRLPSAASRWAATGNAAS